jgi:hypothetical protein
MKKKINENLLQEELKKFKTLLEYDFYQEKKDIPEFKDLLLGNDIEEADDQSNDVDTATDSVAAELGIDSTEDGGEPSMDEPSMDEPSMDEPEDGGEPSLDEPEDSGEPSIGGPTTNDIEVDVTELVKGSEEAKTAADEASRNSEILMKKLNDLESQLNNMSAITNKIENLEKEIVKRNPTPVEKLEMRSLDSYPFNQKLSDYWAEKEGAYDVMDNKEKEYVLTKKDVEDDYSDSTIKNSFNSPNEYEEEDINDYTEENI